MVINATRHTRLYGSNGIVILYSSDPDVRSRLSEAAFSRGPTLHRPASAHVQQLRRQASLVQPTVCQKVTSIGKVLHQKVPVILLVETP